MTAISSAVYSWCPASRPLAPKLQLLTCACSTMQATPANWPNNHQGKEHAGWAFLLPTVTPEDAKTHFPDHVSCKVRLRSLSSAGPGP